MLEWSERERKEERSKSPSTTAADSSSSEEDEVQENSAPEAEEQISAQRVPLSRRTLSAPDIFANNNQLFLTAISERDEEGAEEAAAEEKGDEDEEDPCQIHGYLEEQRAFLEEKLGLDKLLAVYNLIADVESSEDCGEQVDYSTLCSLLGTEGSRYIDDIIQLVVADNFF